VTWGHLFPLVGVLFSALVIVALITGLFHMIMRIRLVRLDTARDRIEWLSFRGSTEVIEAYQALFPNSILPRFCRFTFWAFIFCVAIVLCVIMLKSK